MEKEVERDRLREQGCTAREQQLTAREQQRTLQSLGSLAAITCVTLGAFAFFRYAACVQGSS